MALALGRQNRQRTFLRHAVSGEEAVLTVVEAKKRQVFLTVQASWLAEPLLLLLRYLEAFTVRFPEAGEAATVTQMDHYHNRSRIAIDAPQSVVIYREELLRKREREAARGVAS